MNDVINYWLYTPGEQARKWEECIQQGIMCLGWDSLGNLAHYDSREKIQEILSLETGRRASNDSLANWQFSKEIKPGDIVFAKKGRNVILGMGIVESSYKFDNTRSNYKSIIKVNWTDTGEWTTETVAPIKTLTNISRFQDIIKSYTELVKHNTIVHTDNKFWWLCSNSRSWNFSEWRVGEDKKYSIVTDSGLPRPVASNFDIAKPGDIVLCYDGVNSKSIVGLAIVSEEADTESITFEKIESFNTPLSLKSISDFDIIQNFEFFKFHQRSGLYSLSEEQYYFIYDLIRELNPNAKKQISERYTREEFLSEVFMSESELDSLTSIISSKKNIILQGAPGVGKTFSARRLAYLLMGEKDKSRVAFVQFHQNYSYEDFVMGYKPDGSDFILQKGIFYKFCVTAANNPDQDYFFIIDEINRGNLSKIFGELLMLIENNYRGTRLTLAYNDERFYVPQNLYIIGMMNTADKSLALIDYALRRRFSFISLKPGFDSIGFIQYQKTLNSYKFNKLINCVKRLNDAILEDKTLGEGFEIGHSYFCGQSEISSAWLNQIVRYDIIPTISEYWFDNRSEIDRWSNLLLDSING